MNKDDPELSALVKAQANYHEAPDHLRNRLAMAMSQAQTQTQTQSQAATPRQPTTWQKWWGMGTAFAAGLILALAGMFTYSLLGQQDHLVDQVIDSHVRSLMVAHLSDVASSDQHTVKPWFDGKLDYSPPVRDLVAEGFPLIGGRMDYVDGQQVAALVYRHRLHAINVFVWPAKGKSPFVSASASRQGFNVVSWQHDGMEFWAVSDVNVADLRKFEQLQRAEIELK